MTTSVCWKCWKVEYYSKIAVVEVHVHSLLLLLNSQIDLSLAFLVQSFVPQYLLQYCLEIFLLDAFQSQLQILAHIVFLTLIFLFFYMDSATDLGQM